MVRKQPCKTFFCFLKSFKFNFNFNFNFNSNFNFNFNFDFNFNFNFDRVSASHYYLTSLTQTRDQPKHSISTGMPFWPASAPAAAPHVASDGPCSPLAARSSFLFASCHAWISRRHPSSVIGGGVDNDWETAALVPQAAVLISQCPTAMTRHPECEWVSLPDGIRLD